MKKLLLLSALTIQLLIQAQTTIFSEDFNGNMSATFSTSGLLPSYDWNINRSGADWGARVNTSNLLELSNDATASANANGWIYCFKDLTTNTSWNQTLSNNGVITWTFNMRQIRPDPAGFSTTASYGVAYVLASDSINVTTAGKGYAIVLGQSGATDPIRLVSFSNGLQNSTTNLIISNTTNLIDFGAEYLSIKVTYNSSTNTWELFLRNDGATSFLNPNSGSLVSQGTNVNSTLTSISGMRYTGGYWQGGTGASQLAFFDNITLTRLISTSPCAVSPNLTIYQATNTCPNWTVQLDSTFIPTNKPATSKITWHTGDTAKNNNKMGNLNVDPGTYYISFFDSANNCYSATKAVTVTQTNCNQICFYNENFGTPTLTTGVDTFLGFQNGAPISYKGNVDVRTTSASNGYSGVSGSGNVFFTSTSLPRRLTISGINSLNYKNLQLSFGIMKATSDTFKLNIEVGLDTLNMTPLSYSSVLGQNQWAYITPTGNIPKTNNLFVRFSNSNTSQFRLDDLKLCGEPICNIKPILNDTFALNNCPDTLVNLGVYFQAQNKPAGSVLKWHNSPLPTSSNVLSSLWVKGDSTSYSNLASTNNPSFFYASYFDSVNNCYSATQKVYIVKNICSLSICQTRPVLNDTTASNICPDTTIDLNSKFTAQNKPGNVRISWHTLANANPNNKITNTLITQSGNYYMSYFDSANNCYGPTQKIVFNKISCNTPICQVKPILIDTIISNTCPDTTVNVENVILEQNKPTNAKLTWHNGSNATPNTKLSSLILSQAGDYFVSYFDSANNCYGPTQKVIFDKITCSNTCVNKPNITDTILFNTCPDTTINTNLVVVNGVNFGQTVTWHNSVVADASSEIQKPFLVDQNSTFYIALKETLNNCYTRTQKVQFVINKQQGVNTLVLDTAICSSSSIIFNGRTYSQKGTYVDTIIKNWGCDSFVRIRISYLDSLKTPNLGQSLISNICPDTTINLNQKVTLLNNSVGAILQWHDTTKPTPNNRYFDSIVYSSKVLYAFFKDTNNGCYSNSRMLMVNIKNCDSPQCDTSKILLSFSYANKILSANVAGAALPISYFWNNNNVTKTITVNNSGVYCVTIVDKNGCIKSACTTIQVIPPVNITCNLIANFVWNTQSNGSIQFLDSSRAAGNGMTYLWSFGDGTFSQLKNPLKNYNASGTYTVTLLVYSWSSTQNQICADTVQKQITITSNNTNPCSQIIPNFIWTQNGNVYNFANTTDTTGITIINTQWQFSDGTTINFANPSRSLTIAGNYSVVMRLVVRHKTTNQICTLQVARIINVINNSNICANLKARFSHTKQNNVVNFVNQSTGIVGSPQYLYIISNGDSIKTANGQYTFTKSGMYKITFKVRQNIGNTICTDSTSRLIQIFLSNNCKDSLYQDTFTKCNTFVSPVCGCDSITYANSCLAFKTGLKTYRQGVCANDPNYVKICGFVVNDTNRNCQKDSTDAGIRNIRVRINSGNTSRVAITNSFGYYETWMPKGTFVITQELVVNNTVLNPGVFQRCNLAPISLNANQGGQTYCGNNFYDSLSGCRDLKVALNRYTTTTPGFSQNNIISYQNNSPNTIQNVVLKYKMTTNTTLTFASPTYTVSSNIISWNLGTLAPFASGSKTVKSLVPVNYGLGIVSIDSAWIEPYTSDCNIANNKAVKVDTSVGSYDPNDKTAFPGGNIDTSVKSLTYLIRFQNTGTAPARNVVVEDVITNNIDFNSIRLKSLSHEGQMLIEENRKLIFEFPNIMLPDSASDPEGSIGYITFTANLKDGISVGDEINNFVDIYFDFNDPIRTNTAKNKVVLESNSSINDSDKGYEIRFYPNPMTQGEANILMALQNSSHVTFNLFDIQGRLKWNYEKLRSGSQFLIPVQWYDLPKGIYLLEVKINGTSKEIIRIER
jgi:hypothetical protein